MEVNTDTSIDADIVQPKGTIPEPHSQVMHEGQKIEVPLRSLAEVVRSQVREEMKQFREELAEVTEALDVMNWLKDFLSHPIWGKLKYLMGGVVGGGGWALFVVRVNFPL